MALKGDAAFMAWCCSNPLNRTCGSVGGGACGCGAAGAWADSATARADASATPANNRIG